MIHQFFTGTGNQRFPAPLLTVNLSTYQLINLFTYSRGRRAPFSNTYPRGMLSFKYFCSKREMSRIPWNQ